MKETVEISLKMPDNLVQTLDNVNQKLSQITQASNNTASAWSKMLGHLGTFNTLANATKNLNSAMKVLGVTKNKTIAQLAIEQTKRLALTVAVGADTAATGLNSAAQKLNRAAIEARQEAQNRLIVTTKRGKAATLLYATVLKATSVATKVAAGAMKLLSAAMLANPIGLVVAAIVAAIAVIALLGAGIRRIINIIRRNNQATTEHGKTISDLADYYDRTTEQIEADMERMGTTCLDTWEAQEQGIRALAEELGVSTDQIRDDMEQMGITCIDVFNAQRESIDDLANTWGISADEIREEIAEMVEELGCHEAAMEAWESQQMDMLSDVADEWGMCRYEVLEQMQAMGLAAGEWSQHMGQAWDEFNADVRRNVNDITNNFREIPTEFGQSSADLRQVMNDNIAATADWRDNMAEISGEVPEEMLAWLEGKGPEFNSVIQEMLDCDEELAAWIETFGNATELATDQALDNLDCPMIRDAIVSRLDEAGQAAAESEALPEGYRIAVERAGEAGAEAAEAGGYATGEAYVSGVEEGLEAVDFTPVAAEMDAATRQMESTADNAMRTIEQTFRSGLEASKNHVERAFDAINNKMSASMTRMVMGATFRATQIVTAFGRLHSQLNAAGVTAMVGFNLGLLSMENTVIATARRIAERAAAVMRNALKINSPSRVMMNLGRSTMGGFALGMERMQSHVENVVRNTSRMIENGLGAALNEGKIVQELNLAVSPSDGRQNTLMERLIDAVEAGKHIILDTGELVGATAGQFDHAQGTAFSYNNRWGR